MHDMTRGTMHAATGPDTSNDGDAGSIRGAAVRAGMAGNAVVAFGLACAFAALGGWCAPLIAIMWDVGLQSGGWSASAGRVVGDWWPALVVATLLGPAAMVLGVLWSIAILRRARCAQPVGVTFATLGIVRGAELLLSVTALAPTSAGIGSLMLVLAAALDPLASPLPTMSLVGAGVLGAIGVAGLIVGVLAAPAVALGVGAGVGAWAASWGIAQPATRDAATGR